MVVWSQIGIIGYLLGPLAGIVADSLGYAYVGIVAAAAGVLALALLRTGACRRYSTRAERDMRRRRRAEGERTTRFSSTAGAERYPAGVSRSRERWHDQGPPQLRRG